MRFATEGCILRREPNFTLELHLLKNWESEFEAQNQTYVAQLQF
jgi:hypothetical protein